jgi:16S rRNA (guanine966-N2)-methyltransferase
VREALFSILGQRCLGARVVDLCAGTGALGLEALSRGAEEVTFVERDRLVARVLRENIEKVGLAVAELVESDVFAALRRFARQEQTFDIAFIDPPYEAEMFQPIAEALSQGRLLAPGGVVVVEHPAESEPAPAGLTLEDRRVYGSVALSFFESE